MRRSPSVNAGFAMPGSGSIQGAIAPKPVSGFCPIQAFWEPSGPALTFRLRPRIALCPSKVISKRLPVMLALTFTRKPAFFWRFAKPPSLKMSGCQGSAAYAHSLNASFCSRTVAPAAAKRSFTSTIHASLEMTTARRPSGVDARRQVDAVRHREVAEGVVEGAVEGVGQGEDEDADGRLAGKLVLVVAELRPVGPGEPPDRQDRVRRLSRRRPPAADEGRDQADVLGEHHERVR